MSYNETAKPNVTDFEYAGFGDIGRLVPNTDAERAAAARVIRARATDPLTVLEALGLVGE